MICFPANNPDVLIELVPIALEVMAKQEEKKVAEKVQLSQPVLGLMPFVLVEVTSAEEVGDDIDLHLNVEVGGGLDVPMGVELLKMAIEELEKQVG